MAEKNLYRITFHNQGKIYEVYARRVSDNGLLGFIQVEGLVFGERSSVVVDPSEERIRNEFSGVERTYLPMHAVIRIDEVAQAGPGKISDAKGENVTQFPMPGFPGGKGSG